jgi:hypothetical protein
MAKATTISIKNFLKTTIHPRLQDGVFWLVFIKFQMTNVKSQMPNQFQSSNVQTKKAHKLILAFGFYLSFGICNLDFILFDRG